MELASLIRRDGSIYSFLGHSEEWKVKGHSAVWLHIPIPLSRLISEVSEQGFTLHHGTKSEVLMTKWLQEGRTNRLPRYASHQVGVCGEYLSGVQQI